MKFEDCINRIICGNAIDIMADMPAESVNCIITSPPYWGLRAYKTEPVIWGGNKDCKHKWGKTIKSPKADYRTKDDMIRQGATVGNQRNQEKFNPKTLGNICQLCGAWRGELGLEPTIELYIEHLMMVFDQAKRILRKDGIMFINIGDSYSGSGKDSGKKGKISQSIGNIPMGVCPMTPTPKTNVPAKSLCNIPEKFCIAMEQHGWIKRCNVIWAKGLSFCDTYSGSCMPDSAKDRPNKNGFEWVYMFTKKKHYWYEQQYEEYNYDGRQQTKLMPGGKYADRNAPQTSSNWTHQIEPERWPNKLGRTIRNVWAINPQPFPDAHFATFPEKLVEPMIKMGCPEFVCKKCGKAREKIYDFNLIKTRGNVGEQFGEGRASKDDCGSQYQFSGGVYGRYEKKLKGYTNCGCNAGWRPGVCLDMFRRFGDGRRSSRKIKTGLYSDRIAA